VVLEAVHQVIGRRAAIKVLHAELASNAEYVQRFLNEACAVNSINHPGIVDIYDMGTQADGTAYLIMEFIDGETLTRRMERAGGALPLDDVYWIGREVALAVAAAHKQGIIHRDLKPDNIMIAADPDSLRGERVKLLDFGIAKVRPGRGQAKAETAVGTVMGTLWYMSPEQLKNTADVDDRADVYSLGALLYHLLTGQPPFRASSEAEQIALHLLRTPAPVRELAPHVPEALGQLIDRMLLKDPLLRPAMTEVAARMGSSGSGSLAIPRQTSILPDASSPSLAALAEPLPPNSGLHGPSSLSPISSGRQPLLAPSSYSTMSGAASEVELGQQKQSRRRRLALIVGAALLPSLGLIVWATMKHRGQPDTRVQSASQSAPPGNLQPQPMVPPPAVPPPVAPPPVVEHPVVVERPEVQEKPKSTLPEIDKNRPPQPRKDPLACQRVKVSQQCILDPKGQLSAVEKKAVATAAQAIGLTLCSGQLVRLVREGSRVFFEPRKVITDGNAAVFSGTLQGALAGSQHQLPAEVKLRCVR